MIPFLVVTDAFSQAQFGSYCQQDFQNHWRDTLPYAYDFCSKFNDKLDNTDEKIFYWNLVGAKNEFETDNDQDGLELVDLVMIDTHGSVTDNDVRWVMYEQNVRALSSNMCLGNEAEALRILASYTCDTHKSSDGYMAERWYPVFSCGMQYTLGSHGDVWESENYDECGREFADNMQEGDKLKYAWRDALNEISIYDQDVAVIASGETCDECHTRRDNMKWQNFGDYRRIYDEDNYCFCTTYWTNI